jgi:hypothetical protein
MRASSATSLPPLRILRRKRLQFVAGAANATGQPLLLSANEGSGTTTLYRVVQQNDAANLIQGAGAADTFNAVAATIQSRAPAAMTGSTAVRGTDTAVFGGARADYLIDAERAVPSPCATCAKGRATESTPCPLSNFSNLPTGRAACLSCWWTKPYPSLMTSRVYRAGRAGNDELFAIGADAEGTQLRGKSRR